MIWNRELVEAPPAEAFLADYFEYSPAPIVAADAPQEDGEVVFDTSDMES